MSSPRNTPRHGAATDEAEIVAWLEANPTLFSRHPELWSRMTPPAAPHEDGNVVDLQRFMVQRLQGELARVSGMSSALLDAGRQNMSITARVHEAVLLLMEATSFEHLVHIATQDWTDLLEVDVISLCVEGDPRRVDGVVSAGIYILPVGAVDELLGEGQPVRLRAASGAAPRLYGPAASLVQSDALARLSFGAGAPVGLLALGSRESGKFDPGHGTELLGFLARVLERSVRQWLRIKP